MTEPDPQLVRLTSNGRLTFISIVAATIFYLPYSKGLEDLIASTCIAWLVSFGIVLIVIWKRAPRTKIVAMSIAAALYVLVITATT